MSMNRNERYEAGKDWRRVNDVPVSRATAEVIEKLACAHLAEGDAGMFKLAMSSLAKMQQTSNDSVLLRAIANKLMPELDEEE
jgi:hypothetical protein|tara:strand:+ start:114 stop:362 length:249 start_codon:yes stop_codon:yes gene_type:complete